MDTTAPAIFRELRRISPDIAFAINWQEDPHFEWDGDGPDPRDEGFVPYDADVTAKTIIHGEEYEGKDSLGGVYDLPGEKDLDVHGYLPGMLHSALKELLGDLPDTMSQATEAMNYLEMVMQHRHANQISKRKPKKKQTWNPRRPKL